MQMDVDFQFSITLNHEEFRLIGLALAGKLKGKEIHDAKALNVKLLSQRYTKIKEYFDVYQGALEKAVAEDKENKEI